MFKTPSSLPACAHSWITMLLLLLLLPLKTAP
jgi:hypothetical protein